MNHEEGPHPRGIQAVAAMFAQTKREGRAAFLPYFPVGYPNYEDSISILQSLAEAGADGIEIGIPFSDPLADGPTVQAATQIALEAGTTVESAFRAVEAMRAHGHQLPLFLMSYLNPLLSYGPHEFVQKASDVGADGLIIPDLPPEEADTFITLCELAELALVFFLAPTSDDVRIQLVSERASGFIYVVSLTGTTGARAALPNDLARFIERLRPRCAQPLVLGFGISNAEQASQLDGLVDGFIVGSAMIAAAKQSQAAVRQFTQQIVQRSHGERLRQG